MSTFDVLSPLAPARVRVLVLPAGRIKRQRFKIFNEHLKKVKEVRLGDITPDPRPDRTLFSPLHAPNARILYDYANVFPSESHLSLSPFEIYHEPCVIVGLVDAAEYADTRSVDETLTSTEIEKSNIQLEDWQALHQQLVESYTGALVHRIVVFGVSDQQRQLQGQGDIISLPPLDRFKSTTMMTAVCDLTSAVLSEMTTSVRSIQALPVVPSPEAGRSNYMKPYSEESAEDTKLTRVQSLANGRARSTSPSVRDEFRSHRMSMPVLNTGIAASSVASPRPASPDTQQSHPAQTFDEIAGATGRPAVQRTSSANRVSVTGFGSGGHDEWNRNRGKVRVGVVCASRFLQAGRWTEALRQFTECGTKARALGDHMWHAKALEGALYAMLLLAWAKMDFHIPSICQHLPDRPLSGKGNSVIAPKSSMDGLSGPFATLQDLQHALSDLIYMILTIYQRSRGSSADELPPLCFAEISVRLAGILSALHVTDGVLNSACLQRIVNGPDHRGRSSYVSRFGITPSRIAVSNILIAALPPEEDGPLLRYQDKLELLAGITSLYSEIDLQRKKAFMLKSYLETLVAILKAGGTTQRIERDILEIPARKVSGLHPHSLQGMLEDLYKIYGITTVGFASARDTASDGQDNKVAAESTHHSNLIDAMSDGNYGNIAVKSDILRVFIQLCYDLPDIGSAMQYISTLLRVAGPQIAVSADNSDAAVALSSEEQSALCNALTESALDSVLDLKLRPSYWDKFLVRGLYVLDARPELRLHKQRKDRLLGPTSLAQHASSSSKGPFLYSAFDKVEVAEEDNLLVADEEREFVVSLQNPYDFEVTISSLKLMAGDTLVAKTTQQILLRSNRIQSFSVLGGTQSHGKITVDNCLVEVRGCSEERFSIFTGAWAPELDLRVKDIGLIRPRQAKADRTVEGNDAAQRSSAIVNAPRLPKEVSFQMIVLPPQPILKITSVSIKPGALMLLEGQTVQFTVLIRNIASVEANFIVVTCQDSASSGLLEAAKTKGIQPSEMFAYEEDLALPAVRITDRAACPGGIPAMETAKFDFSVTGRPGLSTATILFDYANIVETGGSTIRTRRISLPLKVTVNASAHITRCDILPLADGFSLPARADLEHLKPASLPLSIPRIGSALVHRQPITVGQDTDTVNGLQPAASTHFFPGSAYSLLILDVRNAWPSPLSIQLSCLIDSDLCDLSPSNALNTWGLSQIIQPGHIERLLIPIPRLHIEHASMNVQRALRTANERQFVISSVSALHPDAERTQRQLFWHRLVLVRMLRATWTTQEGRHSGILPLNGLQLIPRTLSAMQENDISVDLQIITEQVRDSTEHTAPPRTRLAEIKVGQMVILQATLHNRTQTRKIWPLLSLHPTTAHQKTNPATDLSKFLAWSGALQKPLKALAPGESTTASISLSALCAGEFVVTAMIEEMKPAKDTVNNDQVAGQWVDGLHGVVLDQVAAGVGRRNWSSANVCRIVAEAGEAE